MNPTTRSFVFAAAACVCINFVTPAFAVSTVNPLDFTISESAGQYTVANNATAWYIWGFGVSNPAAVGGATATTNFTNWVGVVTQLDFGQSVPVSAFAYATGDADISDINNPVLVTVNLANYIGPGMTVDKFHFTPGVVASDFGLLLIDANGDLAQVNGITTDATTPLPAALPLFGSVFAGAFGLLGWRRRRKQAA